MISLDDARRHVLDRVAVMDAVLVPLDDLVGRVLAEPIVSTLDVPPFANSAMDGFAVRAADIDEPPVTLPIVGSIGAGTPATVALGPGEAMRIMTGAALPDGADSIVKVERCIVADDGSGGEVVTIGAGVKVGAHVRVAGDDVSAGDEVFEAGTVVTPSVLGVLCTLGLDGAVAHGRPVVGVMTTGDELVEPPAPLGPGQIYDSNRRSILALVERSGFATVDLGLVGDDEAAIEAALLDAAERCDAVITTGGVSMGDYDYVKVVLDRIGDMRWMQVAIKPAKPLAFGTITVGEREVPVFGLPGNPVSSLVSFELFARPALRHMAGHRVLDRRVFAAVAADDLRRKPDGKVHFARVELEERDDVRLVVTPSRSQGSHQLASMAHADALAILPDGDGVEAGGSVGIIFLE